MWSEILGRADGVVRQIRDKVHMKVGSRLLIPLSLCRLMHIGHICIILLISSRVYHIWDIFLVYKNSAINGLQKDEKIQKST